MRENLNILKKEFEKIKEMGWIKSHSHGSGNVGITFETMLGKERENFPIADYKGIEIKTNIENYSRPYITLFSSAPDGKYLFQTQILKDKYGKKDEQLKKYNIFYARITADKVRKINDYYMKIEVNKIKKQIILKIYNKNFKLIDNECYWDFETIRKKLDQKILYLAYINADKKYTKKVVYFYYKEITFYKLKNFDNFLKLLANGTIKICFKVGVYKKGPKTGKTYDHGTGFEIKKEDILKLYNKLDNYY